MIGNIASPIVLFTDDFWISPPALVPPRRYPQPYVQAFFAYAEHANRTEPQGSGRDRL